MVASVVALAVGGLAGFVVATENRGAGKAGTTPPTTVGPSPPGSRSSVAERRSL
jgi:hypothetical protein